MVPAPAATLVLLRDRAEGGVETLLIQRHHGSRFAAGDFVFPGGRVEPADMPDDAETWSAGPAPAGAARILGLDGELAADLAGQQRLAVGAHRPVAREIEQVAGADGADVVADRCGRWR